uniref:Aminopeptidase n=1 Tax=Myripristis murdjan TaxID=586833 RepID=A0A668A4Z3_9TELE
MVPTDVLPETWPMELVYAIAVHTLNFHTFYRLPASLVPERYHVTLWPRLTPELSSGLYIFTGEESCDVSSAHDQVLATWTNLKITLFFTKYININIVKTNNRTARAISIQSSWLQPNTQYLVVQLDWELTKGQKYQLYAEFSGELADDLAGFYRSEYEEDGVQKVVATSQMHPTHARKTFPCFDEPAMKAVFHITLLHAPGSVALSNAKSFIFFESANEIIIHVDGVAVTQTRFEPTKRMSSYLLALVVSDYTHLSAKQGDTLIRIWARRKAIEEGHGNYALNLTGPILDFFQQYYNTSYPLSKSDQIALPDFYFGAMENWGLVTYREANLLYDPGTSSNRNRETTATIIAHELAHMVIDYWTDLICPGQWFGNLGFASYVSYLGADYAEPTWNVKDLIVLDDIHRVFAVDALASSHPLSSDEASITLPEQITEQFDAISYSKGAAVLRMLSDFLSEPVFVQGLSVCFYRFLCTYLYMLKHFDKGVSLPRTVDDIMKRWVLQMGFPVVTIDTTTGAVSQEHFLLDADSSDVVTSPFNYEWLIPVRWMRSGEMQADLWWLMERTGMESYKCGCDWVLANINVTGYYRVNYDLANWERLLAQLDTQHQVIPLINRAQLVDDAFNLARAKLLPTTLALGSTSYLSAEREYMPWQSALDNMHYYYLMLDRTDVYQPMQDYMKRLVMPLFLYFKNMTSNWTHAPDRHTDQYNQVNALRMACSTGGAECQNLTTTWFKQWMDNPQHNLIHPNLRSTVYCSAMAAGGAAEWEFAWFQFKKTSVATEASKLMSALACTNSQELLKRYLSYTLQPEMIRKQDATSVIVSVAGNREGQELAWAFVREHWKYMFTQYGVGSFSFASLINGVTMRFSTSAELQQLREFERENGAAGFGSATLAVQQALERTTANIKWLQQNKQEVLDWFSRQTAITE